MAINLKVELTIRLVYGAQGNNRPALLRMVQKTEGNTDMKEEMITTKRGQKFEYFSTLEEGFSTFESAILKPRGFLTTTLLIEYEDGTYCIRDSAVSEGEYKKEGVEVFLLNTEAGVVKIYGKCRITDLDSDKEYSPETDTVDKVYCASGKMRYVYPALYKPRKTY